MAKYEVSVDGKQYEVEIIRDDGRRAVLKVNGQDYQVEARNVSAAPSAASPADVSAANPMPATSLAPTPAARAPVVGGDGMQIRAPMPGLVLEVLAAVGDRVKVGDVVLRLEAMKMENELQSQVEGTVKEVLVAQGDEVQEGQVLVVLEG
jgi:biotin carboxyl carrier protein